MRTHTTLTLRTLIVQDMDIANGEMGKHQIEVWLQTLPEITNEMFKTIHFFTNNIFQRSLVLRQVEQIRHECIKLLDQIEKYPEMSVMMEVLRSATIKCLEQVLQRIADDCSDDLDQQILMPSLHLRCEKVALEANMNLLATVLKNQGADGKLQKLILESMNHLLKSVRCTYYRLAYVKTLQTNLLKCCKNTTKADLDCALLNDLLAINYNTTGFVKYYKQKVADKLAECIEEEEQFKYLRYCENEFGNPYYRKSKLSYDLKCKRVNYVLHNFVKLELGIREERAAQIRKEQRLAAMQQPVQTVKSLVSTYRIRTALSVSALAYLIKLMVEAKVIEPGVRTELLAFICKIFQTSCSGSNGISAVSMGAKYKQVVQSTAKTVRILLVRMLKKLDDEFEC